MEGQAQGPGGADDSLDARGRLMKEVAEQMDAIEADHGSDFRIGRVVTVVEVIQPDSQTEVRVRAQMLPWVAWGLLDFAKKSLGG